MFNLIYTLSVFALVYIVLATEKSPRPVVVLVGVAALILGRALSVQEAWRLIHWPTLLILFGLFAAVEILSAYGFFNALGRQLIRMTKGNARALFVLLPLLACVLSMVLKNIAVMLFLAALTLDICESVPLLDPVVLISAEVCLANAGGGATLIGSPPNLLMADAMGYGFNAVLVNMGPLAGFAALLMLVLYYVSQRPHRTTPGQPPHRAKASILSPRVIFTLWKRIDWSTMAFFAGLFILVGSLEKVGVFTRLAQIVMAHSHRPITLILLFLVSAAVISAFVDNVPMALSMAYLIKAMHGQPGAPPDAILVWATLIGLTIGGNLTPIGASPNIVAYSILERAKHRMGWKRWAELTAFPTLAALAAVSGLVCMKYLLGMY